MRFYFVHITNLAQSARYAAVLIYNGTQNNVRIIRLHRPVLRTCRENNLRNWRNLKLEEEEEKKRRKQTRDENKSAKDYLRIHFYV